MQLAFTQIELKLLFFLISGIGLQAAGEFADDVVYIDMAQNNMRLQDLSGNDREVSSPIILSDQMNITFENI